MTQDNLCYDNKPHNYEPIGSRTIGSGTNQQQIPIQLCSMCGEQSPSKLELAEMDAERSRSLERKLVPDSSERSHSWASDSSHFEDF